MTSAGRGPPDTAAGGLAAVLARHAPRLMALAGVAGVGEGRHGGRPCIVVYLAHDADSAGIPASLDGFAVIVERSGRFAPQRATLGADS